MEINLKFQRPKGSSTTVMFAIPNIGLGQFGRKHIYVKFAIIQAVYTEDGFVNHNYIQPDLSDYQVKRIVHHAKKIADLFLESKGQEAFSTDSKEALQMFRYGNHCHFVIHDLLD